MGNTIKITKSKSFTYKKLNFLYLIFLVFMFFSNSGEYLRHYPALNHTQQSLNERLIEKVNLFNGNDKNKLALKAALESYLLEIEQFETIYLEFKSKNNIEGKRSFDHDFVNSKFRFTGLGENFSKACMDFNVKFKQATNKDLSNEFENIDNLNGSKIELSTFYFQELPNVAFETIMEHFKTVALFNTISYLFEDDFSLSRAELISTKQANFIQKFKSQYALGEKLEILVKAKDGNNIPVVKLNGKSIIPRQIDSLTYLFNQKLSETGDLSLEIVCNEKRVLSSISVSTPEFNIETEKSTFDGVVGEKFYIQLNRDFKLPLGAKLVSQFAEVSLNNGLITVIPTKAGKIAVEMLYNGKIADDFFVFAHEPKQIDVSLQDISGNTANVNQAYRLESTNTFWQVVGFRMTVVSPSGTRKSLRSATRFLRNDLKLLESATQVGSTIVFDEIRVIGKEKGLVNWGKPIIIVK